MERLLYQRVSASETQFSTSQLVEVLRHRTRFLQTLDEVIAENPHYAKLFLGRLINQMESCHNEMSQEDPSLDTDLEQFYTRYFEVMGATPKPAEEEEKITYNLGRPLTVYENPRLLYGFGSTGNRTWEACLFLSEYCIEHPEMFRNKNVLELGAGSGLLSLVLYTNCRPHRLVVTDGEHTNLVRAQRNFAANGASASSDKVKVCTLLWGTDTTSSFLASDAHPYDVVVAADVTYDSAFFPELVQTIVLLIQRNKGIKVFVAETVRNEATSAQFQKTLQQHGLSYEIVHKSADLESLNLSSSVYYKNTGSAIQIYSIYSVTE